MSPPKNYAHTPYPKSAKQYLVKVFQRQNTFQNLLLFSILLFFATLSLLLTPVAYTLKLKKFRFVDIDLDQIGSILYLDTLVKEDKLTKKTPKTRILVLASHTKDGNKYLLNLYSSHVTFVRDIWKKVLLYPFFIHPLFKDDSSHRFEGVHATARISHLIWAEYEKKFGTSSLISMPRVDIKECEQRLKRYLPDQERPFVALHVRDSGFYGLEKQRLRNADINSYKAGINYLIAKGFSVIRIGDPNMVDIAELQVTCGPYLFDYAKSPIKSEMMDTYILSNCAFFAGGTSGPASVPPIFEVNTVATNWFGAMTGPYFLKGDLCTIKKYRYKKDNKLVAFSELFKEPYSTAPSEQKLEDLGVYLEENSPEEILDTFKEYLERNCQPPNEQQLNAKHFVLPSNFAYKSKGNFSNITISSYLNEGKLN